MTNWASEFYAGKTVVVTGGTGGIGLALATAFRDAGATVHALGRFHGRPTADGANASNSLMPKRIVGVVRVGPARTRCSSKE